MEDATYDLGVDEPGAKPRRPGLPVEPRRVLAILWPSRKRLGLVFLVAAAVAIIATSLVPETYQTGAVILYEGAPLLDKPESRPTTRTFVQSAIVPSRLREVRERLEWDIPMRELSERVHASLDSEVSIHLAARGPTPEEAQLLAQTLLDVFLARQAEFNRAKLERLTAENALALEHAEQRREEAQRAFDAFREKSGKPDVLDEKEQLLRRAAELQTKADEAAVEVAAQTALIKELEAAQAELPKQIVASAKRGSVIETPLAQARSELAQARATLSEAHPTVQALKQRVARLQAQQADHPVRLGEQTLVANPARNAVDEQVATARAQLAAAQERGAALEVLLANIKRDAEALAPSEGEARQVLGELDASIARYEELKVREAALRDAARQPLTGFRVLSTPALPEEPRQAKLVIALLFLLPFLALFIAAVTMLVRRLRTLDVEAPREVAWWGNGPVVGTSVWPRDPDALDAFVDELEDQGIYGVGRTLVVPASEAEREIACAFALRLAEAPWLAAAILDVGDRAIDGPANATPPGDPGPVVTPAPAPRRLSSQGIPSVAHGRAVPRKPTIQGFVPPPARDEASPPLVPPAPEPTAGAQSSGPSSSRPPRKKTVVGLPAVQPSDPIPIHPEPIPPRAPASKPADAVSPPSGLQPFQRKRRANASIRMMVPVRGEAAAVETRTSAETDSGEEAFLLTRPVPITGDGSSGAPASHVHEAKNTPQSGATNAVMRAAVRLLGSDDDEVSDLRRSDPPPVRADTEVSGVALAWNGPLAGPVLRRAARLAHRVMVVVSSGLSAVDLARVRTRLGRDKGVGYVLVNVDETYVDRQDRVGAIEEFWQGERDDDPKDPDLR